MSLPPLLSLLEVRERLGQIFPEGIQQRSYLTREIAARTVFVALYIGAIEGTDAWLAPKHVYRMTDEQADTVDPIERNTYRVKIMKPGGRAPGTQWYSDTTREPIRDETLREGLVAFGAAVEKSGVFTTASVPRYALRPDFAALFDPGLRGEGLAAAIRAWQEKRLNREALARIAFMRRASTDADERLLVTFPNGETRHMNPGPSSIITKAVVEVFAPRYLSNPAVLFVSESGNKVVARDDELAKAIGLSIEADKNLPDVVLVDLGTERARLIFIEVVASDGPINERRKLALARIAEEAGFDPRNVSFVTAYLDRARQEFKKTVDSLAWGSYAWFASDPEGLLILARDTRAV